jgi:hypothetical protein
MLFLAIWPDNWGQVFFFGHMNVIGIWGNATHDWDDVPEAKSVNMNSYGFSRQKIALIKASSNPDHATHEIVPFNMLLRRPVMTRGGRARHHMFLFFLEGATHEGKEVLMSFIFVFSSLFSFPLLHKRPEKDPIIRVSKQTPLSSHLGVYHSILCIYATFC